MSSKYSAVLCISICDFYICHNFLFLIIKQNGAYNLAFNWYDFECIHTGGTYFSMLPPPPPPLWKNPAAYGHLILFYPFSIWPDISYLHIDNRYVNFTFISFIS
jgi:hypothetical protein